MTDETLPPGCVTQALGRSWVLSQFANSILSFVTVELLITIPHSFPPSHLLSFSSRPLILLLSRPSRFCNGSSGRFSHLCSHSFSLFLSMPLPLVPRYSCTRILLSYLLGKRQHSFLITSLIVFFSRQERYELALFFALLK